jgi:hypothetical protein
VLAAAVFEPATYHDAREVMLGLRGRRSTKKLHWNEMDQAQQQHVAKKVGALDGFHVVAIGSPLPPKRQERAPAACLTALVMELHGMGVEELLMEARTEALNGRDVRTVRGARYALPKGTRLQVEHVPGAVEPLFWAADIVAGVCACCGHRREGTPVASSGLGSVPQRGCVPTVGCRRCGYTGPPPAAALPPGSNPADGEQPARFSAHPVGSPARGRVPGRPARAWSCWPRCCRGGLAADRAGRERRARRSYGRVITRSWC